MIERINTAIKVLEEDRDIHQEWFDFFEKYPKMEAQTKYSQVGDKAHHKKWADRYDKIVKLLYELKGK